MTGLEACQVLADMLLIVVGATLIGSAFGAGVGVGVGCIVLVAWRSVG